MKPPTKLMIFPILLTFLAACTLPGYGEGISTGGTGATETVVSGNCANPLFPVVDQAVWDYKGVNPVTGEYLISYEISQVGSEGFLLSIVFDTGVAMDQEWTCEGGI